MEIYLVEELSLVPVIQQLQVPLMHPIILAQVHFQWMLELQNLMQLEQPYSILLISEVLEMRHHIVLYALQMENCIFMVLHHLQIFQWQVLLLTLRLMVDHMNYKILLNLMVQIFISHD